MSKPVILHLVHREFLSSVFEAMVARNVAETRQRDWDARIVATVPIGLQWRPRWRSIIRDRVKTWQEEYAVPLTILHSPPTRLKGLWTEAQGLRRIVRKLQAQSRDVIIHCRGPEAVEMALSVGHEAAHPQVIFDVRGIYYVEKLYDHELNGAWRDSQPWPDDVQQLYDLERHMAQVSDARISVSTCMRDHLIEQLGANAERTRMLWNGVDVDRFCWDPNHALEMKQRLKLSDRFVVAYCGSVYPRQCPDQVFQIFNAIRRRIPQAYLMIRTQNPERMTSLAEAHQVHAEDYDVHTIPYDETPDHLAAADVGIISTNIGEPPCTANQVCCPVKFAEYLATGTPPIMSASLGDCSQYAAEHNLGLVLPHDYTQSEIEDRAADFAQQLQSEPQSWQLRCREAAEQDHTFHRTVDGWCELYESMLESNQQAQKLRA